MGLSIAILLGCEFVHIQDAYGDKLQRMNTLFKFHYQAWIMMGLCAPLVVKMLRTAHSWTAGTRQLLRVAVVLLLVLNLVYPFGVSWGRIRGHQQGPKTLDGLAYLEQDRSMTAVQMNWAGDAKAIEWLNNNVEGTPVILEYPGKKAYSYESRVSTNTGLPTLIGWLNHEAIWRRSWVQEDEATVKILKKAGSNIDSWSLVGARQRVADGIYSEKDFHKIRPLLERFQIEYIYAGKLERNNYQPEGLAKFDKHCKKVYQDQGVTIYRVPEEYLS
jgi:uncharacterized membrane protein